MRVRKMIQIKHNKLRIPTGGRMTSWYLQGLEELNSGPPKTNPSRGWEEEINPGPPDYKSSALPLGHARLPDHTKYFQLASYQPFLDLIDVKITPVFEKGLRFG